MAGRDFGKIEKKSAQRDRSISAQPHRTPFLARKLFRTINLCCAAVGNKLCLGACGVPCGLFDFRIAIKYLKFVETPCDRDTCAVWRSNVGFGMHHADFFTSRHTRTCREFGFGLSCDKRSGTQDAVQCGVRPKTVLLTQRFSRLKMTAGCGIIDQ